MTTPTLRTSDAPRFTIVSAVNNVAQYLTHFIDSIETQDFDLSRVQIIMVDGSQGDSLPPATQLGTRSPALVTAVQQSNHGNGTARNLGLRPPRPERWRARCRETGTAGSASGLGKRTRSNPGTAPQADSTTRVD
jgi:hypothetical protein